MKYDAVVVGAALRGPRQPKIWPARAMRVAMLDRARADQALRRGHPAAR